MLNLPAGTTFTFIVGRSLRMSAWAWSAGICNALGHVTALGLGGSSGGDGGGGGGGGDTAVGDREKTARCRAPIIPALLPQTEGPDMFRKCI